MNPVKLSIIVVSYNTAELLQDCLQSVFQNQPKHDFEVIVIDNNSKDNSIAMIEKGFPFVKLLKNNVNLGYAKANNLAIKLTQGDYVLLLNSDTIIFPDTLDAIIDYLDSHPSVGVLGTELLGINREIIQMSWGIFPSIMGEVIQKFLSPIYIRKYTAVRLMVQYLQRKERKVMLVTGAAMTIRKKVLKDVGLLDENFFLYFEEPDFCVRARKGGWDIVFNPAIKIVHRLGSSMKKLDNIVEKIHYRQSQLYFYNKHHSKNQQNLLKIYLFIKFYTAKILCFKKEDKRYCNQLIKLVKESYGKKDFNN